MLLWKTQNNIIANEALVLKCQIKDMISRKHIYVVIRDEVTERFANKESLLVCLHFLNWIHSEPKVEGTFSNPCTRKGAFLEKTWERIS